MFQGKMIFFLHPSAGAAGSTMDFRRAILREQSPRFWVAHICLANTFFTSLTCY
jgi:hypothetical protein